MVSAPIMIVFSHDRCNLSVTRETNSGDQAPEKSDILMLREVSAEINSEMSASSISSSPSASQDSDFVICAQERRILGKVTSCNTVGL